MDQFCRLPLTCAVVLLYETKTSVSRFLSQQYSLSTRVVWASRLCSLGKTSSLWMAANVKFRNLNKGELGGVIFGCTNDTKSECVINQLFGLPAQHFLYVKNIEPGLPLFLFNYSERKLHGIYEAVSSGKMYINSYAWTADGSDRTKYPAQVQIRVQLECQALSEHLFKPIIADNYYSQNHFWFELDHVQASKLMSKLSSLAVASRAYAPQNPLKLTAVMQNFPSSIQRNETPVPYLADDFANSNNSFGTQSSSDDSLYLEGIHQLMEASLGNQIAELEEKDLIYMKLKELSLQRQYSDETITGHVVEVASTEDVDLEREPYENAVLTSDNRNNLCQEMEELKAFKQEQTLKMGNLEKKLAEAELEIHRLQKRCMRLESLPNPSMTIAGDETQIESPDELHLDLNELIFLVGGYDGVAWSSALHSFSPSDDVLRSLKPMSYIRSYTSVARLNKELYVFGGGNGSLWYDTVESYNPANNQWTLRPSLKGKKGNLAGATLNGKIFAVGGGDGVECFSDVEMFDSEVGRWISARSMLQKRFALAAVELNGALYAVGGFDGNDYLKSAERFDPREHCWTRIGSMATKRGCHSVVVMNEKLYAIGGYDGNKMAASVEIYDPRLGTWMSGEPMNLGRGYLSAAALKESIYVIGGVKTNEDMVDKIECYKEGQGWQATNLKAVGKRCFASAIVLQGD